MSGRTGLITIHISPGKCTVIEDKSVGPDEDITEELPQADNIPPIPSGSQDDGASYAPPSPRYSPMDDSSERRGPDFGGMSLIPGPSTGRDNAPGDENADVGAPLDTSTPKQQGGATSCAHESAIESRSASSDSEDECQIVRITAPGAQRINWIHEARRGPCGFGGDVCQLCVGGDL